MQTKLGNYNDQILLFFIILIVVIPIFTVFIHLFFPSTSLWDHLADNLLLQYLSNTFIILFFVSIISSLIGISCAWLVAMYNFPGKNMFKWLLVIPIAIPTYISAYIYAGLVEPSGLVFDFFDNYMDLGRELYALVDLRNIYGSIFILSICLYPYIYLLCYASFKEQSYCAIEIGKSLGLNKRESFTRISLPLARPGIIAGLSLIMMETLAEFGTMDYYGVTTFTTGIYRAWFAFGDETSAMHLASILLTFVFILIVIEKYTRGKSQYYHSSQKNRRANPMVLKGKYKFFAFMWCLLVCLLGSIIPLTQLLVWFTETYNYMFESSYIDIIMNTIFVASLASFIIVTISLYSCYINRSVNSIFTNFSLKIFSLGYAVPGVVIAVGIIIPITMIDDIQAFLFGSPIYYLSGSLTALVIAYLVRFSTISYNATESGLSKIKKNIDLTVKSFGLSNLNIIKKIHIPMMKTTIITSLILVFVDVVKELPATLILRPFNFETFATTAYIYASQDLLEAAAAPSLFLISIASLFILFVSKYILTED